MAWTFNLFDGRKKSPAQRRKQHARCAMRLETLESRQLMAADITATLTGSILTIEGTPWNDNITIRNDGTKVTIDGVKIMSGGAAQVSIPHASVNSVVVDAMGGSDYVEMVELGTAPNARAIPMTVNGGWGDDTIKGTSFSDKLYGTSVSNLNAEYLDNSLGLYVAAEGDYFNSGGKQERWLRSRGTGWYFITPDGSLFQQTQYGQAVGTLVQKFDASFYRDITLLSDAGSGAAAVELDKSLTLVSDGNWTFYENSGGKQEKWLQDIKGQWYFILPDGVLYKQTTSGLAVGSLVTKLDPSYWTNPTKLITAANRFSDVDNIDGRSGVDTIDGGADGDVLVGNGGRDVIHGNAGNDIVWGGTLNNKSYAFDDVDRLYGDNGDDQIHGGEEVDQLWGGTGSDSLSGDSGDDFLYGGTDGDYLFGGFGNDKLFGETGNDFLYGGGNNDRLEGGVGLDYLYGESGDDWLDAGSASEYASGGTNSDGSRENDINAWVTTVAGARMNDLTQGSSLTCWILASMGAVSQFEDLSQRITYLGDGLYKVNLYKRIDIMNAQTGGYKLDPVYVRFNGTRIASDPLMNTQEGETWMIIMHRAIIQAVAKFDPTQTLTSPHSGGAQDALAMLLGKWAPLTSASNLGNITKLSELVAASKGVVVHTTGTATTLVKNHCYIVLGRSGNNVQLYNPWGSTLTVSWSVFQKDTGAIVYV